MSCVAQRKFMARKSPVSVLMAGFVPSLPGLGIGVQGLARFQFPQNVDWRICAPPLSPMVLEFWGACMRCVE